ncbi:MAG: substrate-binding domain-containing protein [Elusimicrobiota bacterium]
MLSEAKSRFSGKKTKLIDIIFPPSTPDVSSAYYYVEILKGIEVGVRIHNYGALMFASHVESDKIVYEKNFDAGIVDGIIIIAYPIEKEIVQTLRNKKVPTVSIACDHPKLSYVKIDNRFGVFKVVEYLIKLGHKKIGIINGTKESPDNDERFHSFKLALEKHGLKISDDLIGFGDFDEKLGYYIMKKMLAQSSNPTAVFCANDLMAIGAINAVREVGLNVPEDISIVGFDDIGRAQIVHPPLTTVKQDSFELGKLAVEILVKQIEEPSTKVTQIILQPELIIRKSCAKAVNHKS